MEELLKKHCREYSSFDKPLNRKEVLIFEERVPEWNVKNKKLLREFAFDDFKKAVEFFNGVALIAEDDNHHPDIEIFGWNKVRVKLSTHKVNGLTENDFIIAAKVSELID